MTAYASRAQLLQRCNLLRLVQLAVPTGGVMPDTDLVYGALTGGDTSSATVEEGAALAEAVQAVDTALTDGADLMRSHGLPAPAAPVPQVLTRINVTLALYYLASRAGPVGDEERRAYDAAVKLLDQHARGDIALIPPDDSGVATTDTAHISSGPGRYGVAVDSDDEVGLL